MQRRWRDVSRNHTRGYAVPASARSRSQERRRVSRSGSEACEEVEIMHSPLFLVDHRPRRARHQRAVSGLSVKMPRHVAASLTRPCQAVFLDLRGLAVTLHAGSRKAAARRLVTTSMVDRGAWERYARHFTKERADRERGGHAVTAASDPGAWRRPGPRAVAFDNADVHLEGVARAERRDIIAAASASTASSFIFLMTPLPQVRGTEQVRARSIR